MADPTDPWEAEAARRAPKADPWEEEAKKRRAANMTTGETVSEGGEHLVRGLSEGIVNAVTLPYQLVQKSVAAQTAMRKKAGETEAPDAWHMTPAEEMPLYKPFLVQPEADSTLGKVAHAAGKVVGESVLPEAAMFAGARRLPLAPLQRPQTVGERLLTPYAETPGRALAADAVAATSSGAAQEIAHESGFGPTGQMIAGIAGGAAPFVAAAPFTHARRAYNQARATADPHAKVAASLPEDISVDDLAHSLATGHAGIDPGGRYAQRVIDTLGEEMVNAGGNRQAALAAALARLEAEGGVSAATARNQLRSVRNAQGDSQLMLGEQPSVLRGDDATRLRRPDTIMGDIDTANAMPNAEAAARARTAADPGRIEDTGTHWMLDTVANGGSGPSSQTVRNAVENRLSSLAHQMRQRIQQWAPHGADTYDAEAALDRMRQTGRAAYNAVYNAPGGTAVNYPMLHGLLERAIDRNLQRVGGLGGDHATELRAAIDRFYNERPAGVASRAAIPDIQDELVSARQAVREARRQRLPKDQIDNLSRNAEQVAENLRLTRRDATPATQKYLMPTLEQLQVMRSGLRRQMGDPTRPDLDVVLRPLYNDVTRAMERASPAWRRANQQWADLELDTVARELGENFSTQAGPRFREQMRDFNRLAPEAQDYVRVEVAQKLADKLANMGDGENLAKIFKTPHMRQMVRTMFGDEAAVDMMRLARDNKVAAKTKGMMGGSPTQPRQARQAELNSDINLLNEAEIPTSLGGFLTAVKKYTLGRWAERRNRQMADILTTPVRDTATAAMHIESMRRARASAARYANPRLTNPGVAGQVGGVLSAADDDGPGPLHVSIPWPEPRRP